VQAKDKVIYTIDKGSFMTFGKGEGRADNTIDHEIETAKSMVFKAFDNDMVSGEALRTFKKVKKMVKKPGASGKKWGE